MSIERPEGTEGYAEHAPGLLDRYERRDPEIVHAPILDLIPRGPGTALDLGAGAGRAAAYFAARGFDVLAVEPTPEMREPGRLLHPSARIEWMDDALPRLERVLGLGRTYDIVMLQAVWMHLDAEQRAEAMPRVAALTHGGSRVFISLRHGPVPAGRRMLEVSGEETSSLAQAAGFVELLRETRGSADPKNRAAGIRWTRLAYERV